MASVTVQEIKGQHLAWCDVLDNYYSTHMDVFKFIDSSSHSDLALIGCGTSFYLSLSAASTYTGITGLPARAVTASDVLLYSNTLFPRGRSYLGIPISRSGKTTETVRAAKYVKNELKMETIALTCTPHSELVKLATRSLLAEKAMEKSVVMTQSFTSMLLVIQLMAAARSKNEAFREDLMKLPECGKRIISDFETLAVEIAEHPEIDCFTYLGQGPYYGLACESMLKMKEMSLSVSEAYHSMEYRHGPISILNKGTLVVFLMSESGREQEIKILEEVKELGGKTLVICERANGSITKSSDYLLELNSKVGDFARLVLYMPVIQLLGYYRAIRKGLNPDNPKNLTQVVVLE
jgi:glucosamine--fructose-6-phosphate aminotransferase (isomerizing)